MSRYSDRRKQTRRYNARRPARTLFTNEQANILTGLNVLDTLEKHAKTYMDDVHWYGADSFSGKDWASSLIWFRKQGLHTQTYQQLTLFGVWAIAQDNSTQLQLGTKPLQYAAPIYTPEAYFQLIKRGFKTYYNDSGNPPEAQYITQTFDFSPETRIALRDELSDAIKAWMIARHHKSSD